MQQPRSLWPTSMWSLLSWWPSYRKWAQSVKALEISSIVWQQEALMNSSNLKDLLCWWNTTLKKHTMRHPQKALGKTGWQGPIELLTGTISGEKILRITYSGNRAGSTLFHLITIFDYIQIYSITFLLLTGSVLKIWLLLGWFWLIEQVFTLLDLRFILFDGITFPVQIGTDRVSLHIGASSAEGLAR